MRTYGLLSCDDNHFILDKLEPHVCIRLKAIFTKIPKHQTCPFKFDKRDDVAYDLRWFSARFPLACTEEAVDELEKCCNNFESHIGKMEEILSPNYVPNEFKINGELRKYQSQAVDLLLKCKRLLVGDDVGLGKTLIAIGAMTNKECLPMAIVAQTHLPIQWKEQINKFIPELRVEIISKRKMYSLPEADVYIFRYSNISGWVDFFVNGFFKAVVFDEIQELRHTGSQKYNSAKVLTSKSTFCLGLSATPIYNKGPEIFNIIDLISKDSLGDYYDFMREWTNWDVVLDPKALGSYLRERHLFLRRTREDVGMELPPVNKIIHTVDYDQEKIDSVMDLAKKLSMKVRDASFVERGQAARELDLMMRYFTGVSKAKFVAQYVKIMLDNGEKVLLAGWHRDVYDIWNEELKDYNPVMFTGSESPAEKEKSKQDFISGKSQIMFISLRSGVGLDGLQSVCSNVVFGELDWSPGVHEQVIGRLYRDGQKEQVTAIYLISDSGSDPLIVELLGLKASQAHGINDPLKLIEQVHSDESRIKMLADRILNKTGGSYEQNESIN